MVTALYILVFSTNIKYFENTKDIDHLTRILMFCGKPDNDFLEKITSEEVSFCKLKQT